MKHYWAFGAAIITALLFNIATTFCVIFYDLGMQPHDALLLASLFAVISNILIAVAVWKAVE